MNLINKQSVKKSYSELISLTQLFLLREHHMSEKCLMEKHAFPHIKAKRPYVPPSIKTLPDMPKAIPVESAPLIPAEPLKTSVKTEENKALTPPPHQQEKKSLVLEPLSTPPLFSVDMSYMQFFKEHFPQCPLSSTIPSDEKAHKMRHAWKLKHQVLPVLILSFQENNQSLDFLKNVAKAISVFLAPASLLSASNFEKEAQWDEVLATPDLRLIIASDYELYLQPNLMKHYTQDKQLGKHYLKTIPLLLLSDISLYLKKPELKEVLWNAIRTEFNH